MLRDVLFLSCCIVGGLLVLASCGLFIEVGTNEDSEWKRAMVSIYRCVMGSGSDRISSWPPLSSNGPSPPTGSALYETGPAMPAFHHWRSSNHALGPLYYCIWQVPLHYSANTLGNMSLTQNGNQTCSCEPIGLAILLH